MPTRKLIPALALLIATACQTSSEPGRRDILGSWVADDLPGTMIHMTLGETIGVAGAGAWIQEEQSTAFAITGAVAGDEVALYFDFPDIEDVAFQGYFTDDDVITGAFNGGSLRNAPVTFEREDLFEDG
jgi:hypothetical protein